MTHPEATHDVERLVGGWYDADLTAPNGIEQAERIATSIAARAPPQATALTSSDLRRTRRTAEAIAARLDVDPLLDPGLREQSYGAAEGLPVGTIDFTPLPVAGDRIRHHDGVTGSETRLDLATRAYAALDRVIERGAEHSVGDPRGQRNIHHRSVDRHAPGVPRLGEVQACPRKYQRPASTRPGQRPAGRIAQRGRAPQLTRPATTGPSVESNCFRSVRLTD